MKNIWLVVVFATLVHAGVLAQGANADGSLKLYPDRTLMIEPGVGIHTNYGTDFLITNLLQWNPSRNLSFAAHTSFNINNAFHREFNYVKTDYNYSINQKLGVGATIYQKKSSHTFLMMFGAKYTAFKETLSNPNLDKASTTISALSPDYGFMYSMKKGLGKYYFSYRMYVPLYPWPVKGSDINYVDGNLNNIALELAFGIRLR